MKNDCSTLNYNISPKLLKQMQSVMNNRMISIIDDYLGMGECQLQFIHFIINTMLKTHKELLLLTSKYYTRKSNGGIL